MHDFSKYKTLVFDMDGTLVRSNLLKEDGLAGTVGPLFGMEAENCMRQIHRTSGSISRKERFERFVGEFLDMAPGSAQSDKLVDALLMSANLRIKNSMQRSQVMDGVFEFLGVHSNHRKVVVTGSPVDEAMDLLAAHALLPAFDAVYGVSRNKTDTLKFLLGTGEIQHDAVYFGDTADDMSAAVANGMDGIMITMESTMGDQDYVRRSFVDSDAQQVTMVYDFASLMA